MVTLPFFEWPYHQMSQWGRGVKTESCELVGFQRRVHMERNLPFRCMWPLGRPYRPPPPSAHGAPFRYITRVAPFVTRAAKGAWKVPTMAPVYLRHVHLPDARLTPHARKQQEAHLRASASLRLDPPCPRRALIDQNVRAWRTSSLLRATEMLKWT